MDPRLTEVAEALAEALETADPDTTAKLEKVLTDTEYTVPMGGKEAADQLSVLVAHICEAVDAF